MNGEIALWAGVASFFGSLLASGIFDVFGSVEWESYLGAFLVAGITGGAVYAGERYNAAKSAQRVTPKPSSRKPTR